MRPSKKKQQILNEYDNEVRMLERELSLKVDRLKMERDKKLDDVRLDYAKYEDAYRQWKNENRKLELELNIK